MTTSYSSPFYSYINDLLEVLNGVRHLANNGFAFSNLFKISNDKEPTYLSFAPSWMKSHFGG